MMNVNYYLSSLVAAASLLSLLSTTSSQALEITIVESRSGGSNFAWYAEGGAWADSTAKSTASGCSPPTLGSRYSTAIGTSFSASPVLQDGATYTVDITHGTSGSIPTSINVAVAVTGGTMDVTNTGVFARTPDHVWERVGILTLEPGTTTPTVTFTKLSQAADGNRFYADAVRFTLVDNPCLLVPELTTVNGPLAAGQTFVDVPMTNTAQAVTVYANGVQIGQLADAVVGLNRVTTPPLVRGQVIAATQTRGTGIESCVPVGGQIVGSGPNAPIGIAISIRQTNLMESAIGANGGSPGSILKFIGATGNTGPSGAPVGNKVFYPSNEWQTVQFQRGDNPEAPIDPTFNWNAADATFGNQLGYNFGVFDAIAFAIEEDTGPFAIYIDEFRNGDTRVTGWEGAVLGQSPATLNLPGISGTTSGNLLARSPGTFNPNISMVTNNTAAAGSHSLYVSWQFNTTNRSAWLRLPANSTGTGTTPNPIVDLRLPISFRMLILPVGQPPPPRGAVATAGPGNQRVIRTGSVTMRADYGGTPPISFQWQHNGVDIPNATNATLTLNNVQLSDAGPYTLFVSNAHGSDESPSGTLTVEDVPFTDIMTPLWRLPAGSRPYLTNDNNTRSIAYLPNTGHLLVASRSASSNAIYILDGETGSHIGALTPPANGFTGGTLVLNQVAVAEDDGTIYACNLTTDGATNFFKIYRWFDEFDTSPIVLWEGNPANDPNIHLRWGDAIALRGFSGAREIVVSSGGTLVAFILPDFPSVAITDFGPTGAQTGAFRLGLAAAPGSIIWGKVNGQPLLRAQVDESFSGAILDSFTGLNPMTAIGVHSTLGLLGGVFVDNPDHFRLFDISTPGGITAIDTEFFGTDNANANATGSIAFGGDTKIYALDSNNGLVAMNLNTACLPDRLTIERSGSDVILRWNRSTYHLEGTPTLGGGWTPITGGSPTTLPATGNQFFRLVCPAIP